MHHRPQKARENSCSDTFVLDVVGIVWMSETTPRDRQDVTHSKALADVVDRSQYV